MKISTIFVVAYLSYPVTSKSLRNLKSSKAGKSGATGGENNPRVPGNCNSDTEDCINRVGGTRTADATSRAIECIPAGQGVGMELANRQFWRNLETDQFGAYIPPEGADLCNDDCDCASACCWTNGGFGIELVENVVTTVKFCGNIEGLVDPAVLNGCVNPRGIPVNITGGSL